MYLHSIHASSELVYRCAKQHSEPGSDRRTFCGRVLIARIYEVFRLLCPICGGPMRIIAFIKAVVIAEGFAGFAKPYLISRWVFKALQVAD